MAHIWTLLMCSALVISVTAHPTPEVISEYTSVSTRPSNDRTTAFSLESSTSPVTQSTHFPTESPEVSSEEDTEDIVVAPVTQSTQDFPTESPEVSSEEDAGDMVVAETIVFRPLFRYRHDSAERRWGSSRHNYRNHWGSRPSYHY